METSTRWRVFSTERQRIPNHAYSIIDHLSPNDALAILRILVHEDDRLGARIAEVATSYLSNVVDPEEIALDLYAELDALNVEEVWDRAGASRAAGQRDVVTGEQLPKFR